MTTLLEINSWTGRMDDVYAPPMAAAEDDEPMSAHAIRVPEALWKAFGEACRAKGSSRSVEIRRHMVAEVAAYVREQRRIARESDGAEQQRRTSAG